MVNITASQLLNGIDVSSSAFTNIDFLI